MTAHETNAPRHSATASERRCPTCAAPAGPNAQVGHLRSRSRRWLAAVTGVLHCALVATNPVSAAPADEVVVVFNSGSEDSKYVATHYAFARGVATNRIFGLPMPDRPAFTRAEFNDLLAKPLRDGLAARGLVEFSDTTAKDPVTGETYSWQRAASANLRYIVLCRGVPYSITHDASISTNGLPKMHDILRHTGAAVDADLALLFRDPRQYSMYGPVPNPFLTATNAAVLHPTNQVVIVARLDGPTTDIAHGLVDKAMLAERNGLFGRAYFDTRSIATNDPYYLGDRWIAAAHEMSRRAGFECELDRAPATMPLTAPVSDIALYVGWYTQDADGPWAEPATRFLPGAFAYHLHSFSAADLRSETKHWTGPLLARGAAATMGCVNEPLLGLTPNLEVFFINWLARGMTFGEAALLCQPGLSWQTTIIGDPLYRPFAMPLPQLHARLEAEQNPSRDWAVLHGINHNLARGTAPDALARILLAYAPAKTNAVLLEKMGDLQDSMGRLTASADWWESAFQRQTDPGARARLALKLAKVLALLEKKDKAQQLLSTASQAMTNPKARVTLIERQIELLTALKRTDEAAQLKAELDRLTAPPITP